MRPAYRIVERTAGNQNAYVVQSRIAWCWIDFNGGVFRDLTDARNCIFMLRLAEESPPPDRVVEYHK